jgi:hypothetical protein
MLTSKTMKSLLRKRGGITIRFFSTDDSSSPSKFGDFTQKIDEATLKAPIVSENEIKFDSKCDKQLILI